MKRIHVLFGALLLGLGLALPLAANADEASDTEARENAAAAQDELEGRAPKKAEPHKRPTSAEERSEANDGDEQKEKEEPPKPFTLQDQPRSITVPGVLYGPWLNIFAGFGMETSEDLAKKKTQKKTSVYLTHINAAGGFGLLDNTLGLDFRATFDVVGGARSNFRLNSFGTSLHYTFYNKKPLTQTVSLDLDFDNQFFTKFYSFDVVRVRPSYMLGVGIWRFSLIPFVGVPMYVDANNGNDKRLFADRTLYNWDKAHNFMGGLDYGVPISFNVWRERFLISCDPTGETMFWGVKDPQTTIWVTPGLRLNFGIALLVGVQYMAWSTNDELYRTQRWRLILQGGLAF